MTAPALTPDQRKAAFANLLARYGVAERLAGRSGVPLLEMDARWKAAVHLGTQVLAAFNGICDLYEDAAKVKP